MGSPSTATPANLSKRCERQRPHVSTKSTHRRGGGRHAAQPPARPTRPGRPRHRHQRPQTVLSDGRWDCRDRVVAGFGRSLAGAGRLPAGAWHVLGRPPANSRQVIGRPEAGFGRFRAGPGQVNCGGACLLCLSNICQLIVFVAKIYRGPAREHQSYMPPGVRGRPPLSPFREVRSAHATRPPASPPREGDCRVGIDTPTPTASRFKKIRHIVA